MGYAAGSGDYNADGNNLDYPDASSYSQSTDNKAWLTGAIPKSNFAIPAFGREVMKSRCSSAVRTSIETSINVYKDTRITERVNFQIRFEIFNLFNRANYVDLGNIGIDMNFPDGNFGQARASHEPRFWQLGGKISF